MAFVSSGYDHVVANMFIIPFGMRLGNHLPIGHYIVYSMIPSFLGKFLSSVFMVSFTYSMCYGTLPDRIGAWLTSSGTSSPNLLTTQLQSSLALCMELTVSSLYIYHADQSHASYGSAQQVTAAHGLLVFTDRLLTITICFSFWLINFCLLLCTKLCRSYVQNQQNNFCSRTSACSEPCLHHEAYGVLTA